MKLALTTLLLVGVMLGAELAAAAAAPPDRMAKNARGEIRTCFD
jgi:hypothetical protein